MATTVAPSPIPQRLLPVMERDNTFSLPWYRYFQNILTAQQGGLTPAQVEALIAAALVPIQSEIDALQAEIDALDLGSNMYGLLAVAEADGYGG